MSNIEPLIEEVEKYNAEIHRLQQTISAQVFELNQKKTEVQDKLNKEIFEAVKADLAGNDYGCGTANSETANFKLKVVVSKKVKWDEDELRKVAEKIKAAGRDPEEFIKYKLSVSETEFKKFPDVVQYEFLPARSVEPSAPVITYERK
jgi:signal recognition particle GTPase